MKIYKDIIYDMQNQLKLDMYIPEIGAFDTFIFFHGGGLEGGSKEDAKSFVKDLVSENIAVISVDYRLYPNAKFPDYINDCSNAVSWVINNIKNYGNSKEIYIGGSSAGGYISMMLCFDQRYLNKVGLSNGDISGYIHDAGQPTSHFNILRERGIDSRRIIVDETAPLYFVGLEKTYPKMLFVVSDHDVENRFEQTQLMVSSIKSFGYDMTKIKLKVMEGLHTAYLNLYDEHKRNIFANILKEFIKEV